MKIFLGLPIYREADVSFLASLLALVAAPPAGLQFTVRLLAGDSLICRARNTLTAEFLASDCSHLLWIDSDLVFSGAQIARLAGHGVPVVAGMYPKKQDHDGSIEWCLNSLPGPPVPRPDGLQAVRYAGTGFMLISRLVFAQMLDRWPALAYRPDGSAPDAPVHHDFWSVGPVAGPALGPRYLSEDWYFCDRCQQLGVPVLVDPAVILKHVGTCVYPTARQMEMWEGKREA